MDELIFSGNVVNGIGKHSQLSVPGRDAFQGLPIDWPERLCPGSLNVKITSYPEEFVRRGITLSTTSLDTAGFLPEFTIAQSAMGNNRLIPTPNTYEAP